MFKFKFYLQFMHRFKKKFTFHLNDEIKKETCETNQLAVDNSYYRQSKSDRETERIKW